LLVKMLPFPQNVGQWPSWSNLVGLVPIGVTPLIIIQFLFVCPLILLPIPVPNVLTMTSK
jgi:hypothetical protein